ncbi:MAG: ImmA/IrrE family metallo-endopeptidase [Jatrophihabitans sp.]
MRSPSSPQSWHTQSLPATAQMAGKPGFNLRAASAGTPSTAASAKRQDEPQSVTPQIDDAEGGRHGVDDDEPDGQIPHLVAQLRSPQSIGSRARQHFVKERPEIWSALLTRYDLQHVVLYNPAHSPERIRSNLAHELAHLAAEHELTEAWLDDQGHCSGSSSDQEQEAAELAGALLVPAEVAHAIRGGDVEALAAKYEVSVPMARWRMQASGGQKIALRAQNRTRTRSRQRTRCGRARTAGSLLRPPRWLASFCSRRTELCRWSDQKPASY